MLNLTLSEESVYNIRLFEGEDHFIPCLWKDSTGSTVDLGDYTLAGWVWGSGVPIALADNLTEVNLLVVEDDQSTNPGAFQVMVTGVGYGCEFRTCNPSPNSYISSSCPQLGLTSGIFRVRATHQPTGSNEILLKGTMEVVSSVSGCFSDGTTPNTSD